MMAGEQSAIYWRFSEPMSLCIVPGVWADIEDLSEIDIVEFPLSERPMVSWTGDQL
jgi:hypothetical protein